MRYTGILIAIGLIAAVAPVWAQSPAKPQSLEALASELTLLRDQARQRPDDAQIQYRLGELLKALDKNSEAARCFSNAGKLSPDMYVSFHQLSLVSDDAELLDDAIERLTARQADKPDELMLRVALSELLEKRGNFQQAARPLIDITYANKVPEKYKNRVSARIHHLLALARNAQQQQPVETAEAEEQLDVVPSPLPSQPSKRSIASAKMKDSKEVKGVGKVPLLP